MSKHLQISTETIAIHNASKDGYTTIIIKYKSEVATINDSANQSIFNYTLESLNINSIQTTTEKYKLESNSIINNLKDAISLAKSEYVLLLNKNPTKENKLHIRKWIFLNAREILYETNISNYTKIE